VIFPLRRMVTESKDEELQLQSLWALYVSGGFNDAFATFHRFAGKPECLLRLDQYPEILEVRFADGTPAPLEQWAVARALRGESSTDAEYHLKRTDTGQSWVGSFSFAPIRGEAGEIAGSVVVGRDITAMKAMQVELERSHAALQRLLAAQDRVQEQERLRIARDLHDLLGHTLSLIILKSELASKLAERDVERARNEIRDVERISRDALAQVRSAVRGYRDGGLKQELDSAREALRTAGIDVTVEMQPVTMPAAHEAVLALAIREATTNIVRHARARRCTIEVVQNGAECTATIRDDGVGGNASPGTGLTGMRERVESLGGTLRHDGAHGMTITITLPLTTPFAGERTA